MRPFFYILFLQVLGANNNKIGNNSNLPAIISIVKTNFEKSENKEKLPLGPITFVKPGPTLFIHVSEAEKLVCKKNPGSLNKL